MSYTEVKLLKVKTSVASEPQSRWIQSVPSVLLGAFSGLEYDFVARLLINHPGPAALLCGVSHCRGLIWLHSGPSPFQNRWALSADQTALGRAFVPAPLLSRSESRFGPCRSISTPPPSVSLSACQSLSFRHTSVTSAFLFPVCLYHSTVTHSLCPSPCIYHPPKHTHTSDRSA